MTSSKIRWLQHVRLSFLPRVLFKKFKPEVYSEGYFPLNSIETPATVALFLNMSSCGINRYSCSYLSYVKASSPVRFLVNQVFRLLNL